MGKHYQDPSSKSNNVCRDAPCLGAGVGTHLHALQLLVLPVVHSQRPNEADVHAQSAMLPGALQADEDTIPAARENEESGWEMGFAGAGCKNNNSHLNMLQAERC